MQPPDYEVNDFFPQPDAVVDGYRLIRPIGRGGFGTVWLCWSDATQSFHAFKWVAEEGGGLELELAALRRFREVSQALRSPHLIPIEHIHRLSRGFFYILPLADGTTESPSDPNWMPLTLADRIAARSDEEEWFSPGEILGILVPVARIVGEINNLDLVHRDIKPANILFFNGVPCLSDLGLLAGDATMVSQRGTPGFLAPSWYLESAGRPDMWGLATTLYTLLTGNHPDKLGRARFLWPPQGMESLDPARQKEWQRLHKIVFRATHEIPAERFLSFSAFVDALEARPAQQPVELSARKARQRDIQILAALAILFAVTTIAAIFVKGNFSDSGKSSADTASPALEKEPAAPRSPDAAEIVVEPAINHRAVEPPTAVSSETPAQTPSDSQPVAMPEAPPAPHSSMPLIEEVSTDHVTASDLPPPPAAVEAVEPAPAPHIAGPSASSKPAELPAPTAPAVRAEAQTPPAPVPAPEKSTAAEIPREQIDQIAERVQRAVERPRPEPADMDAFRADFQRMNQEIAESMKGLRKSMPATPKISGDDATKDRATRTKKTPENPEDERTPTVPDIGMPDLSMP